MLFFVFREGGGVRGFMVVWVGSRITLSSGFGRVGGFVRFFAGI